MLFLHVTVIILNLLKIICLCVTKYARAIISQFHSANFSRDIIVILRHWCGNFTIVF